MEDAEEWAQEGEGAGLRSRSSRRHRPATLTLEQRLEVATSELDCARKDTLQSRLAADKAIEKLKVGAAVGHRRSHRSTRGGFHAQRMLNNYHDHSENTIAMRHCSLSFNKRKSALPI